MSKAPRFRQLQMADLDAPAAKVAEKIIGYAGGLRGPFNMMMRSPELTDLCFELGSYLLNTSPLPRRLKEMAVLMRARFSHCDTEWVPHERLALAAGLDPALIADLKLGRRPASMHPDEATLYDYCAQLLTADAVDDATFAAAITVFGERGVTDITALIGFYGMIALFIKAAELGTAGNPAPLEPVATPFQPNAA